MIKMDDIKMKAWELKGSTNYWDAIHKIEDDLKLMNPLIKRLKTCPFALEVRIANKPFDMIFKDWCYNITYVEDVYAVYVVLDSLVRDIYNETGMYTDKEKHDYLEWCYDSGIDISEFVKYTIGCSRGITGTLCEVDKIMREIEKEREI